MIGPALLEGLEVCEARAWGEANCPQTNLSALKGRGIGEQGGGFVPALQALGDVVERTTWACARRPRSIPGCHIAGRWP